MQMKNFIGKLHCSAFTFTFINLRGALADYDFVSTRPFLLKNVCICWLLPIEFNISEFTL